MIRWSRWWLPLDTRHKGFHFSWSRSPIPIVSCLLSRFFQNGWRLERCTTYMVGTGLLDQRSHSKRKTRETMTKTDMVWCLKDNESPKQRKETAWTDWTYNMWLLNLSFIDALLFSRERSCLFWAARDILSTHSHFRSNLIEDILFAEHHKMCSDLVSLRNYSQAVLVPAIFVLPWSPSGIIMSQRKG